MALSPEELQIAQYGQKQGKSQQEVMDAISSYRQSKVVQPVAPKEPGIMSKIGSGIMGAVKTVGNALTSSEQAFGNDMAAGIGGNMFANDIAKSNQALSNSDLSYLKAVKNSRDKIVASGGDTSRYDNILKNFHASDGTQMTDLFPALAKSNGQVVGDAAGVLLDVLSSGSYGQVFKDAKALQGGAKIADIVGNSGKLVTKTGGIVGNLASKVGIPTAESAVAPVIQQTAKQTLGQTLKSIGTKTAVRAGIGGATGYGYDVSQNLQNGATGLGVAKPGWGTALGTAVPIAIGGIQAGMAITKAEAPRIINSLVKPKQADFSYGKDPGRTVSQMGITGNSMEDFATNIHTAKNDVGTMIGDIYSNPANANVRINADDAIAKIDAEIKNAAAGGKNNQSIVTQLQNIKDSLIHSHGIDAEGNIIRTSTVPKELGNLTAEEAFNLKSAVADHTQFTGRPSDDKKVNTVLKNIYGSLKEKLNSALSVNNPEIIDLNQKYADLTSAEIATKNRNMIIQRSNVVSMPIKVGGVVGLVTSLGTGVGVIPVLTAIGAGSLDKALGTAAVKTRMAAWLGSQKPSTVNKILTQNPSIRTVIYRVWPKLASQLGKE